MQPRFWLDKWDKNEIRFHQERPNQLMTEWFSERDLSGKRVLVPLCGKTKDMIWLNEKGLEVIGVELSEKATLAFFEENKIAYKKTKIDDTIARFDSKHITIYQGDFFEFKDNAPFDFIFDRAALIALPAEMRIRYAKKIKFFITANTKMLLITIDYDQEKMDGPPFSVTENEVENLYCEFQVKTFSKEGPLPQKFRTTELNLTQLGFEISG